MIEEIVLKLEKSLIELSVLNATPFPEKPWPQVWPESGPVPGLTRESLKKYRDDWVLWDCTKNEARKVRSESVVLAADLLKELGFRRQPYSQKRGWPKTLEEALAPFLESKLERFSSPSFFSREEDRLRAVEAEQRKSEGDAARKELETLAVQWLLQRGKAYGADFTAETAVQVANDIAFEEEVARRQAEGGFIEFSGDDSCEDCKGWDMVSNRCECGNRRVAFTSCYGSDFRDVCVYAEAS